MGAEMYGRQTGRSVNVQKEDPIFAAVASGKNSVCVYACALEKHTKCLRFKTTSNSFFSPSVSCVCTYSECTPHRRDWLIQMMHEVKFRRWQRIWLSCTDTEHSTWWVLGAQSLHFKAVKFTFQRWNSISIRYICYLWTDLRRFVRWWSWKRMHSSYLFIRSNETTNRNKRHCATLEALNSNSYWCSSVKHHE